MRPDEALLLPLAASISDGDAVDWRRAETDAALDEERQIIRHLRIIADLAQFHQTQNAAVTTPPPAIETLATLAARRKDPTPDEPVKEWGPLRLLERIGQGNYGEVFRAWDASLDREVALKLYRQADPATPGGSIVEEGRLLARVRHPNVVTVHGAERHDGRAGIWMELIRGRSLAEIVREQGPFGAREAMLVGIDLCRALAATHRATLVHGDIKASNIMREEGGRIVLMDFSAGAESPLVDHSGRISGTPLYMAPELFRGGSVSVRSDIYSLGVLLHHLVTGGFPVSGRSVAELAEAHESGRRTLLRDERPDLPEPFLEAVERAAAVDPARRHESAGAFESAIVRALGFGSSSEAAVAPAAVASAGSIAPLRRWPFYAAAALGLALAGAVLTVQRKVAPMVSPSPLTTASPEASLGEGPTQPRPLASVKATPASVAVLPRPTATSEAVAPTPTAPANSPARSPYTVEAAFYRSRGAEADLLLPGARVALGDQLYLQFQASSRLHVYVINEDERGAAFLLFPLPGQDLTNPLPAGARLRLPGSQHGSPQFWQVTSEGSREHFLIVASPDRLVELEAELLTLDRASAGRPLTTSLLGEGAFPAHRGVGGLASGAPVDAGAQPRRLSELAQRLLARPETVQGIFVRQFSLQNPGS